MKKIVAAVMAVSGLMILLAATGCLCGGIGFAAQTQPEILEALPDLAERFGNLGRFFAALSAGAAVVAVVIALKLMMPLRCIGIACAEALGFLAIMAMTVLTQGYWIGFLVPGLPEGTDIRALQTAVLRQSGISFVLTLGILAAVIVLVNGILRRNVPEGAHS